ncbi:amidase [Williamsia deligens]|uniref:amidase n=1 Tax=Williamsia deligens TaxID=321325 RepID=A0ABW3G871_9NOCA|nr:amidase family protein [Williamsia deligens]MCP2194306.1 amidase [Williamsia deligens]
MTETAVGIAEAVASGRRSPREVVDAALARIAERDGALNAFVSVEADAARAEADALAGRDLAGLPLAGVPVAIKDNVPVAGVPQRVGSAATSSRPSAEDHPLVTRLRAAGAVVVGVTAVPELCLWGATDTPGRITRNPWNPELTPGGSSGGAAAAVASGQVPIAHGNDGLGSIRIPSADCGLFGIKPGRGVVPPQTSGNGWYGMSENGPLATTVADAALMLGVMADDPSLGAAGRDTGRAPVGVVVAENFPLAVGSTDRHWAGALSDAAAALTEIGHRVTSSPLPYPTNPAPLLLRWVGGAAADADEIGSHGGDLSRLQPRTRRHTALGRLVNRRGLVRDEQRTAIVTSVEQYLERTGSDLVMTPMLARPPLPARQWSGRGWLANMYANIGYAPFAGLVNVLQWPGMSVPMGVHPESRTPMAVHLFGRPGSETLLLAVAAQLEQARPWPLVAPGFA